jgi:hypothetical protein
LDHWVSAWKTDGVSEFSRSFLLVEEYITDLVVAAAIELVAVIDKKHVRRIASGNQEVVAENPFFFGWFKDVEVTPHQRGRPVRRPESHAKVIDPLVSANLGASDNMFLESKE